MNESEKEKSTFLTWQTLLVRAVEPVDFGQWKPLQDGYNAFYGRRGETALPEEVSNPTWSRFFDGCEPMHALVAGQSGMLLEACGSPPPSPQHDRDRANLLFAGFIHARIRRGGERRRAR